MVNWVELLFFYLENYIISIRFFSNIKPPSYALELLLFEKLRYKLFEMEF